MCYPVLIVHQIFLKGNSVFFKLHLLLFVIYNDIRKQRKGGLDMTEKINMHSDLIDEDLKKGLKDVLGKLTGPVTVKAVVDAESEKGREMAGFLSVIASLSGYISLELYGTDEEGAEELDRALLPAAGLYKDGRYSGISFHGVPGGQEINSFVLALYNLAGPGQQIGYWTKKKIEKIEGNVKIRVCVSLACHHCPKMVSACQRLAALNDGIEAAMIDANLFPQLVEKYKIERVPLTIIDEDEKISGVKTIDEMAELVKMHVKKK